MFEQKIIHSEWQNSQIEAKAELLDKLMDFFPKVEIEEALVYFGDEKVTVNPMTFIVRSFMIQKDIPVGTDEIKYRAFIRFHYNQA